MTVSPETRADTSTFVPAAHLGEHQHCIMVSELPSLAAAFVAFLSCIVMEL